MKILKFLMVFVVVISCSKKSNNDEINKRWAIDVNNIDVNVEVNDISKDFYNLKVSIPEFRKKYPFYLAQDVPDSRFEKDRRDTMELHIYSEIKKKVNNDRIKSDLTDLFKHLKYYYPEFKEPKVFLYSSFTADYLNPIMYISNENYLLIATDCFLGYGNKYYDMMKIDRYLQRTMSQEFLSSKVARELIKGMSLIPNELTSQSFISQMIYQGKILILEDAFLPNVNDRYKIGYSKDQIEWARSNEFEIWNFFIQNNYLFSDDLSLSDRFLSLAPFSKFYTEVDAQSPGQIGCWIGWQICRKYLKENSKISLQDFIRNANHEEIFARSKYKPKPIDQVITEEKEKNK